MAALFSANTDTHLSVFFFSVTFGVDSHHCNWHEYLQYVRWNLINATLGKWSAKHMCTEGQNGMSMRWWNNPIKLGFKISKWRKIVSRSKRNYVRHLTWRSGGFLCCKKSVGVLFLLLGEPGEQLRNITPSPSMVWCYLSQYLSVDFAQSIYCLSDCLWVWMFKLSPSLPKLPKLPPSLCPVRPVQCLINTNHWV